MSNYLPLIHQLNFALHNDPNPAVNFRNFKALLLSNDQIELYHYFMRAGYTNFPTAQKWFQTYYFEQQHGTPTQRAQIKAQIETAAADPKRFTHFWYSKPDPQFGDFALPTAFQVVPSHVLNDTMLDVIDQLKHDRTTIEQLQLPLKEA